MVLIRIVLCLLAALSEDPMDDLVNDFDELYDPWRNAVRKEKAQNEPDYLLDESDDWEIPINA